MSASEIARGLPPEDLEKLYIRFSRVVTLLGFEKQVGYLARRQGRFPLRTVVELNRIWCYSAEVDAHMRGHHRDCLHTEMRLAPLPSTMEVAYEHPSTARDIEMVRLHRKGISTGRIARKFGLSRQRVDQILARWKIEPPDEDDEPEELLQ